MKYLKAFFRTINSFCVRHSREIFFSAVGFFVACLLWVALLLLPSCRGLWSFDLKGESEKGKVHTTVNYVDNEIAVSGNGENSEKSEE